MTTSLPIHPVRVRLAAILACALALGLGLGLASDPAAAKVGSGKGGVRLKKVAKFDEPLYVASPKGTKLLYVVEQGGMIRIVRKGKKLKQPFLDIRGKVTYGGEQGLLSVAFPPNHPFTGLFYVYYVTTGGDIAIEEYRRISARLADPASARRLLTIPHPDDVNHNGGQLQFGPDGLLYAATGDGGGAGDPNDNAQDANSLLGKLLRIHPAPHGALPYTIPAGNPFAVGGRREIYSMGLRNPWRFSFDTTTKKRKRKPRIAIADVGQNRFEEINYLKLVRAAGANFGWNDFEGFAPFSGAHPPPPSRHDTPIKVYKLGGRLCSVTGGYVSRSKKLPTIRGRYVYGDFCAGKLRSFVPKLGGAKKDRPLKVRVPLLSSFGEAAGGLLYATSLKGTVYRLVDKSKKKRRGKRR